MNFGQEKSLTPPTKHTFDSEKAGKMLRKMICRHGIKPSALAAVMGVPRSHIDHWFNGRAFNEGRFKSAVEAMKTLIEGKGK